MSENNLETAASLADRRSEELTDLLSRLAAAGVVVELDNDEVKVRGWTLVEPADREVLRSRRAEVVALLKADVEVLADAPPPPPPPPPRPDVRDYVEGRGESYFVQKYLIDAGVPENEWNIFEIQAARNAFLYRLGS